MWRQSRRCDVTSFPIGWVHTRNDSCRWLSVIWGLRYKTLPGTGAGKSAKQTLCTPKWWYFCPGTATVSIVRRFSVVRALSRYGLALHAPSGFKYSDYIATIWNWSYFNVTAPIMTSMLILSHTVLSSEDWTNRYLLCSILVADQSCQHIEAEKNGRHLADIFKCIFLNENISISLKISLKFVPKVRINNIPALVHCNVVSHWLGAYT